jgi:cell division septation protein DedD
MRLRHIIGMAGTVALMGGGIWFFVSGTGNNAVGAGGLPLIKADSKPAKVAPEEPGGDVMPNADSTVFSAIGAEVGVDPSMENLKMPAGERPAEMPEFAGLKTGFAVPAQPEKVVEDLFAPTPTAKTKNDYVSGIAPDVLPPEPAVTVEEKPEPVKAEEPNPETRAEVKAEPESEVKKEEQKKDATPPAEPVIAAEDLINPAQAMEQQEKAMIAPQVKPVIPPSKPAGLKTDVKPVAKAETKPAAAPVKSGYYMQLASTPSKEEAPRLWARLQEKYPAALSGLTPVYQTATVPGKGEYIRVQAGPVTQQQANDRCKQLHAIDAKGGCLVFKR